MSTQRYSVRQINLFPIAKFGCLLGGLAMVFPSVICALGSTQLISSLRTRLEERDVPTLPLPLGEVSFDIIELLGLETFEQIIIRLDDQATLVGLFVVIATILAGGLFIGGTTLLLGSSYNILARLTGGVELELVER